MHIKPNRKIIPLSALQVKSGTIFDNFLITDDPKLAEEVGKETWGKTKVRPSLCYSGFTKTRTCLFHSWRPLCGPQDAEKKMKEGQEEEERKKREEEDKLRREEAKEEDEEEDEKDEEEDDEEEEEEDEEGKEQQLEEEEEEEDEEGIDSQLKDEL